MRLVLDRTVRPQTLLFILREAVVFICYLDESGVVEHGAQGTHFVLLGFAIPASDWRACDLAVAKLKTAHRLQNIEIHTGWMARLYPEQERITGFEAMPDEDRRRAVRAERKADLAKGQLRGAKAVRSLAVNYRKSDPYIHLMRGERVSLLRAVADEALRLYEEAAAIDPNDPVSHSSIAYLYLRGGEAASALEPALAALARAPTGPTHWMRLGDVYAKLEDQARALAAYDQALTFNPSSEAVILRKGDLLWKAGDETGARTAWQPACTAGSEAACQRVRQGAPGQSADRGLR